MSDAFWAAAFACAAAIMSAIFSYLAKANTDVIHKEVNSERTWMRERIIALEKAAVLEKAAQLVEARMRGKEPPA